MENWVQPVIMLIISTGIGVIGFFLARAFGRIDKSATKDDLEIIDKRLEKTEKAVEKNEKSIDKIREDYITKEDFFREQGKTDKKLDRIMDILLELKGGK